MKILSTIAELQTALAAHQNIGFVPTMGALHSGHISLVNAARKQCEVVVVSVFVNPTQFNDPADLERYPRNLDADAALLCDAGATYLFAPTVEQIYPSGNKTPFVITSPALLPLTTVMEGRQRPGHFDGVVQVVSRLFDIVRPTKAFFGEKDFQQLAIIVAMVADSGYDVQIVGCPIVRAQSGLALSSRNALLTADQKDKASNIHSVLSTLKDEIENGVTVESAVEKAVLQINKIEYLCSEYIEVVDASTLQPWIGDGKFRVCAAVHCGDVRLIDNV